MWASNAVAIHLNVRAIGEIANAFIVVASATRETADAFWKLATRTFLSASTQAPRLIAI